MAQAPNLKLVLASQSPRRVELLANLGLQFDVLPSNIEEVFEKQQPELVVQDLAAQKAQAVAQRLKNGDNEPTLVLGADTIVVLGKEILGKPQNREDAYQMLVRMSGRCHQVYTGVVLIDVISGERTVNHEISNVYFRSLDPTEVRAYARTDEPMDKAGTYALQGTASAFVDRIDGCYTNVIGLPVPLTVRMLRAAGVRILGLP